MASLADVFTDKERTNWLKAWLAVDIAKSGLEQFVVNEAKAFHASIYNNVRSGLQAPTITCTSCHTANLLKCPTAGICNKRGANGACKSMHDTPAKQPKGCPSQICDNVRAEIVKEHRYNVCSWKNTSAQFWQLNAWEIAKCYFPPDGYAAKSSVQDTDFNGVISFMLNCKHFDLKFNFTIAPGKNNPSCLLTKARDIGRTVRHSSQCTVADTDLKDIFNTLTNLLTDQTCLVHDMCAKEAVRKLIELGNDTLKITTKEMIDLLEAANDTLKKVETEAEKTLTEFSTYKETCKNELEAYLKKCKQDIDESAAQHIANLSELADNHMTKLSEQSDQHIAKMSKQADRHIHDIDERIKNSTSTETNEVNYKQACKELTEGMMQLYNDTFSHVTTSPLNDVVDERLRDIYMPPKIERMRKDKGTFKKTSERVTQYKDVFLTDGKVNRKIFLQGESGSGKSTFATKLALDWSGKKPRELESSEENSVSESSSEKNSGSESDASKLMLDEYNKSRTWPVYSEESDIASTSEFSEDASLDFLCDSEEWSFAHSDNGSYIFNDLNSVQEHMFVFHITLRNSVKQSDITKMIKEQIIDSIYTEEDRGKAYILLNEIMKKERCLIVLDGLDEWTGPGGKHTLPTLVAAHCKCVLFFTTRPWKLAEGKIKHSEIDTLLQLEGINAPLHLSKIILSRMVDKKDLDDTHAAFKRYTKKHNLKQLLSSPMMLSLIVCSYAEGTELQGSQCAIYSLLLDSLLKKASKEQGFFLNPPCPCFTDTLYLKPNIEHVNVLAKVAFEFLFSERKENSLVFSAKKLLEYVTHIQKEFALQSGILSEIPHSARTRLSSACSFIHKSIQEFLAAYHIACNTHLVNDVIAGYLNCHDDAILEISQVFIFLCGLNVSAANELSSLMNERDVAFYDVDDIQHPEFQRITLSGFREAIANKQTNIHLKLSYFDIDDDNIKDLHSIWAINKANVQSLCVTMDSAPGTQSSPEIGGSASRIEFDVSSCKQMKKLQLVGECIQLTDIDISATSDSLVWILLNSTDPAQCADPAAVLPSIEYIYLCGVTCSCTSLRNLLNTVQTFGHKVECLLDNCAIPLCVEEVACISYTVIRTSISITYFNNTFEKLLIFNDSPGLWEALHGLKIKSLSLIGQGGGFIVDCVSSLSQSLSSLTQLESLSITVQVDSPGLWEALHGLKIKSLSLSSVIGSLMVVYASSLSQSLSSLTQLETLSITVDVESPGLWEALHGLKIKSLSLSLSLRYEWRGSRVGYASSLSQSLSSLTQLETLSIPLDVDSPGMKEPLHGLKIKSLSLYDLLGCFRVDCVSSVWQSLSSLTQLETLSITVRVDSPGLWEALHGLKIKSLSLRGIIGSFMVVYASSLSQSLSSLTQLETLSITVDVKSPGLWEALHGLKIKSLSLRLSGASSLSQSLSSLTQLETLKLYSNAYINLRLPQSLQYLECSCLKLFPSQLRDLLNKLSSCNQSVECKLQYGRHGIAPEEYIPIQQELDSLEHVVVKRFRIYERTSEPYKYTASSWPVRDIVVAEYDHDDDMFEGEVRRTFRGDHNHISVRLLINCSKHPASAS